jgi:hypothetical protein
MRDQDAHVEGAEEAREKDAEPDQVTRELTYDQAQDGPTGAVQGAHDVDGVDENVHAAEALMMLLGSAVPQGSSEKQKRKMRGKNKEATPSRGKGGGGEDAEGCGIFGSARGQKAAAQGGMGGKTGKRTVGDADRPLGAFPEMGVEGERAATGRSGLEEAEGQASDKVLDPTDIGQVKRAIEDEEHRGEINTNSAKRLLCLHELLDDCRKQGLLNFEKGPTGTNCILGWYGFLL